MANRRQGGNRPFSNNYSMPVSPWQGGMPPGSNAMGIQPGYSQLTDTQAQLALALTNLLRPQPLQQQSHLPQQQPPSLLNMPHINFGNHPDFRQHPYNRNNRPVDNRRNRHNDNKMTPRAGRNADPHRRLNQTNKSFEQRKSGGRIAYRTTIPANKYKKDSETAKVEDPDAKDGVNHDNQSEELPDKKRDWKEEKNCEVNEDGNETKTSAEPSNSNKDEVTTKEEEPSELKLDESLETINNSNIKKDSETNQKHNKDGKYYGVPARLLRCMVCEKNMWDGESFEKHLRGRAHKQMFESMDDSYKIKANMMRAELRLTEEKKMIELNRMKRLGKNVSLRKKNHCNMCDFKFFGHTSAHRKSEGHQKLKMFLHPRCRQCNTEFPTRMEWEVHRLTPEHLRITAERKSATNDDVINVVGEVEKVEDETPNLNDSDRDEDNESDNKILDIEDNMDLKDLNNRLPIFKKSRSVGLSLIKKVTGHYCKPCQRFFLTDSSANAHSKSMEHYDKFIALLRQKQENTKEVTDNKISVEQPVKEDLEDDEGNWKRRKIANDGEGEEEVKLKTENQPDPGTELYDPMEAEEEEEEEAEDSEFAHLGAIDEAQSGDVEDAQISEEMWSKIDKDLNLLADEIAQDIGNNSTSVKNNEESNNVEGKPSPRTRNRTSPAKPNLKPPPQTRSRKLL